MEKQERFSLLRKVGDAFFFIGILGVAAYLVSGYGISQAADIWGGAATRFENIAGYSGTRRVWSPANGWQSRFLFTDRDGKVKTEVRSNGKLEAIIIDNNMGPELEGGDYVVTSVGGKRYRFYANGQVADKDGKDDVGDKAVTGKSKEILEKWNLFLTTNFK